MNVRVLVFRLLIIVAVVVASSAQTFLSFAPEPGAHVRAQVDPPPTLILDPSSGLAPAVSGFLLGSYWCSQTGVNVTSVPPGRVTGSGSTV
ncbi:MAG: hypothetical protein KC470_04785, partial [Dehalococcoidia bacterium]|nr:hypothetical protein [Dehalococcoidia bacterium]